MKTPVALMALTLTAFLWSQAGVASNVGSPAYQPDGQSILLDTSPKSSVTFDGSSDKNKSKLRSNTKKCSKGDKDCDDK